MERVFCVFNDIALAAQYLLDQGLAQRILIIDLDVHQGNGTAKIFENEQRVFTLSVHGAKNYPAKKMQSDLDIPLRDKTEDSLYLQTLTSTFPKLLHTFEPDFVFYLSGVDVLHTDKLGRLSLTMQGCKQRDEHVIQQCHKHQIPIAISMGGGYSERIADIIEAHANTFRIAQNIYF